VSDELSLPRHYWRGRPQEEREAYLEALGLERHVKAWIILARDDFDAARMLLANLAGLLRADDLPASGREYLADLLDKIAQGADLSELLPRKRKKKAYTPSEVLAAVEREKMKLRQERADRFIYDAVGRQFDIKGSTAAKEASIGLSHLRKLVNMIDRDRMSISATERWDKMIVSMAVRQMGLPEERVRHLLFGPLFEK
jgi:hypothetical protein